MKEITVLAVTENVEVVTDFINAELEEQGCPMKAQMQIDIAIDEIFSNIASYAYDKNEGNATVKIDFNESPLTAIITFSDEGIPYNPLLRDDPDVTLSADDRGIGGLGIYLVKKTMNDVSYEYKDNRNILTISKILS